MKHVFVAFLMATTTMSVAAQTYSATKRLWGCWLRDLVLTNQAGETFIEVVLNPDDPRAPSTFLETGGLPSATVFVSANEMHGRGPYVGYDVNGNGDADVLESYGKWSTLVTFDVFTDHERKTALKGVDGLQYGDPASCRVLDADHDGYNDLLYMEGPVLTIFWGDKEQPLENRTRVLPDAADGLTLGGLFLVGDLGGSFCLLGRAGIKAGDTTVPMLNLSTLDRDLLKSHPVEILYEPGRMVSGFPSDYSLFTSDSLWHVTDVASRASWRVTATATDPIECSPSLSVIDGRRPLQNADVIGQKSWHGSASVANLDQTVLVRRLEHTGGPLEDRTYYLTTDRYTIVDPTILEMRFDGCVFHHPGRYNTVGLRKTQLLPDQDGDGHPEIVASYTSGQWKSPFVDIFLSSYTIQASNEDEQGADVSVSVRPTTAGWVVSGMQAGADERIQLIDVLGRNVPITVSRSAAQWSIEAGSSPTGPLWLIVGARAFPVLR